MALNRIVNFLKNFVLDNLILENSSRDYSRSKSRKSAKKSFLMTLPIKSIKFYFA